MRISAKRRQELFKAIDEPVMDLRIVIAKGENSIDAKLFRLAIDIHARVKKALGIEDQGEMETRGA